MTKTYQVTCLKFRALYFGIIRLRVATLDKVLYLMLVIYLILCTQTN